MSNADRGKCEALLPNALGSGAPIGCDLLSGHSGMHHDDRTGADWAQGAAAGAGTVEYAVQCNEDKYIVGPMGNALFGARRYAVHQEDDPAHRFCGGHRVIQRTVTEWTPVEDNG